MPRVLAGAVLSLLVLFAAASAHAQPKPLVTNRPAATLLLPYFEVDLDNANGATTLFSINNASATAVLGHVTVWSDLGIPVFAFNVYLTGYDLQTINLRDVFTGTVPRTASVGQDPTGTISPKGDLSQDINFASCSGQLPPPTVPASYRDHLRASLTGSGSSFYGGQCVGRNVGTPSIARGYVTVDTVNNCTLRMAGDPGYFSPGGTGDVTNQNVLYGDYQLVDPGKDFSIGEPLVHIRAGGGSGVGNTTAFPVEELSTPGSYTFYGRFVNWTAADNREPLSTAFATRFVAAKEFKQENRALLQTILPPATELLVWRDSKSAAAPFACGGTPAWYPLGQGQIAAFDEQENFEVVAASGLGAATQRVAVASNALPVTPESGWMYLNLNTTATNQVVGLTDPAIAQAWVTVLHRVYQGPTGGRYDAGLRAIRIDTARAPRTNNLQ